MIITELHVHTEKVPHSVCIMSYYPESIPIGVDTLSTYGMTNNMNDFFDTPQKCTGNVVGVKKTNTQLS